MDPTRPDAAPRRIAFLGFGLIGGSIALALRQRGCASAIVAWTPDGVDPAAGLAAGALDAASASPAEAIRDADLIVLASPVQGVLRTLVDLAGPLRPSIAPGATITDVASTKVRIAEAANAGELPFVGGHPMAGRETSGFAAATADLFIGRPWVITPTAGATAADAASVAWLATAVGASPVRMTPADHDRAVAAISHLPLVVAAALVEAVAGANANDAAGWTDARTLAASGWAGMTRLASGDPDMGAGILETNAAEVANRLRDLRRVLDGWIDDLERRPADRDHLRDRLAAARARLEDR
jgi:prephenate dehydrogenase